MTARFLLAVGQEIGTGVLSPSVLARAAVSVLPIDGAGLSTVVGALRIPLGSSSDAAAQAEELQTTLGEGPCLDAGAAEATVVLDLADLTTHWPLYSEELSVRTPFRAVAAVPLRAPGRGVFAALDLYSTSEELSDQIDLAEIDQRLAGPVTALLTVCLEQVHDVELRESRPEWYETAAGRRHNVWLALGMLMATSPSRARDALSLMRAHAFSQDCSLDDLATDIVDGRVAPTDLID